MFGRDNYFLDLLMKDISERSKDMLYTSSTKLKDFDIEGFLKKHTGKTDWTGIVKSEPISGMYTLQLEVPGFTKEQIDINLDKGELTITGKSDKRDFNRLIHIGDDEILKVILELGILYINIKEVKTKDKSTKINID